MDLVELQSLLEHGEETWLDWKANFPQPLLGSSGNPNWDHGKAELLKDLVSIANGEGEKIGYLIYGVKDHRTWREILGIFKSWDDADFQTWAHNVFDPSLKFLYTELSIDGDPVGCFEIERVPEYPHVCISSTGGVLFEGQVWFRKGSKNAVAHHDDLVRMVRGEEPFLLDNPEDPILINIVREHERVGEKVGGVRFDRLDSLLASGYKLVRLPGTRRPVYAGGTKKEPDLVYLYKPNR